MKDLISVIVPVYNVEAYLRECLESIIHQEYKNLEIILVDDGSTDNSGIICDEFASKDQRIKVIHKKNGGLSDARNVGIETATGDYISFIDSDDYVSLNYFSYLQKLISNNDADIAVCQFVHVDEVGNLLKLGGEAINEVIIGKEKCMETFLYYDTIETTAWRKLYKRKLFDTGIRFPVGRYHEDIFTTYKLIGNSNVIAIGSEGLYAYRKRKSSIVNSKFSPRHLDAICGKVECFEYISLYYPKLAYKVSQNIINLIILSGVKMLNANVSMSPYISSLQVLFRKHFFNYLKSVKSVPNFCYVVLGAINLRILFYIIRPMIQSES